MRGFAVALAGLSAALAFAAPAHAAGQPDLEVYTACGGALPGMPPPLSVIVRNIGSATAENVTVDYWSPFGPTGSRFAAAIEPGDIVNYPVGQARTLELLAASVRSGTPDADPANNVVVQPMFCLPSM
ncbi:MULTISPECIES: DUF11 domain-containing protein [unclassified Nocardia]|uniref:DUF11 domain-containing protein n=1 Tax=unclassified Nocardia TaxID=2637762 RepID=UPI001CE46FAD|nr:MULTISPECIES: DUF11 domain-containing protein [unclassified Nocardia]